MLDKHDIYVTWFNINNMLNTCEELKKTLN